VALWRHAADRYKSPQIRLLHERRAPGRSRHLKRIVGLSLTQRPVRAALQLQIMTPSSLWSHVGSDLQLFDFCIALQFSTPMQPHLCSPSGVSKQLKVARASEGARDNAATSVSRRRAVRISPSISRRAFNYSTTDGATVPTPLGTPVAGHHFLFRWLLAGRFRESVEIL
jgi:hypothetical protein